MATTQSNPSAMVSNEIKNAWRLRENLRLDEFVIKVLELNQIKKFEDVSEVSEFDKESQIELELLNLSLLRSRGKIDEAEAIHFRLDEMIRKGEYPTTFKFHSEGGLNRMYRADPVGALENFMAAQITGHRAGRPDQVASALLNILLCMEWLELPTTDTEKKLFAIADKLPEQGNHQTGLRSLIQAYQFRKQFADGKFSLIFSSEKTEPGQPAYLRLWIRSLPYVAQLSQSGQAGYDFDIANFMGQEQSFRRNYRIRTLQFSLHADDLKDRSLTDCVDRIYLWVWKWMTTGDASILERLMKVLEHFPDYGMKSSDSVERIKLSSALRWIRIFDTHSAPFVERCLASIPQAKSLVSPLLKFESDFICWTESHLNAEPEYTRTDLLHEMKLSPLWNSDEQLLGNTIKNVLQESQAPVDSRLEFFAHRLTKRILPEANNNDEILVNTDSGEIIVRREKGTHKTVSDSLSLALSHLEKTESVTFEEFALFVFGIRRFDSFLHQPKIYNLLNRMKLLLGSKDLVQTRQGRIYKTEFWPKIGLKGESFSKKAAWSSLTQSVFSKTSGEKTSTSKNLDNLFTLETIRISDWVKHLNRPRSTTIRHLKAWLELGYVSKKGFGKNTTYHIDSPSRLKLALEENL